MPNHGTPAERYRYLAAECLSAANSFPDGDQRDALLQMARVWQRLADQYADATVSLSQPSAGEQPAVQQQQKVRRR
jgi:hypothetical protein